VRLVGYLKRYLCAFVGFGTISNCSMHSYGSFKIQRLVLR